jgi:hypothetical protein
MFKKLSVLFILIGSFCASESYAESEIKLFSSEGYPYKLLINRTDSVKILFTESKEGIACRVEVAKSMKYQITELVNVTKEQFEQKPLASCLPRVQAKSILASTF